jgi:hypothetical protein
MNVRLTFIFGFFLFGLMGEQALLASDALKVHGILREELLFEFSGLLLSLFCRLFLISQ